MASAKSSPAPSLPFLFHLRSSKTTILTMITIAIGTDMFLYSVIVPVLPFALHSRLGAPEEEVQYYVSLLLAMYAFGIMVFSPICGYFADLYPSRKAPFMLGLLVLVLANALLCFATNMTILLIGRLLQGGAAAVVWAIGYAMVPETVGLKKAGAAIGWVTMGTGGGLLLGPTAGGIVYDHFGYYAVFGMSFAILAFDALMRGFVIERKTAEMIEQQYRKDLDIYDSCQYGEVPETTPLLKPIAKAPQETNQQASKFPIGLLLSTPRFVTALWGINILAMMLTSLDGTLPLFVHRTFAWGPSEAGLIFLVIAASSFFDPVFGHQSDKFGARWLAIVAFLVAIPAYLVIPFLTEDTAIIKFMLCVVLFVISVCVCMGCTPLCADSAAVVMEYKQKSPEVFGEGGAYAQCFALCNVAWALGSLLGPLLAGFLAETYNFGTMALAFAALCGVTTIPMLLFCGLPLEGIESP